MKAVSPVWAAIREFVRNPEAVGSAFPATSHMVKRILDPMDWGQIDLLVEFGPGTGRFTFDALARMRPDTKLLAIEPGEAFVKHLRSASHDPRLIVVQDEAQRLRDIMNSLGLEKADCILSGLPFSTLDPDDAAAILDGCWSVLDTKGSFVAYQMRRRIERYLKKRFEIKRRDRVIWNIPPCHIIWAGPADS